MYKNIKMMISNLLRPIRTAPKWLRRTLLIVMGIIIIIFNDAFGGEEPFVAISVLYFFFLFFLLLRWIFQQIRFIIRLKSEQAKTELLHLKSQVNPHFFFNMLNNLYGLVDKDTDKAKELILQLSEMMRYSIYEGQKDEVALEDEIIYLQRYIELHKMRYHKNIEVHFDYQTDGKDYRVMPLLYIILLENAFKHGVENLRKDAFIYLSLEARNNKIHFDIENNFDHQQEPKKRGIGLDNLQRRLELVYPNKHRLRCKVREDLYAAHLSIKV